MNKISKNDIMRIQLSLLNSIDAFCKENKISYTH